MQGARAIRLVARNFMANTRRNYGHGHIRETTMNDLPVPEGDFFAAHNKQQTKYNAVLAAGIASVTFAIGLAKVSGLIFLNYDPPATYE